MTTTTTRKLLTGVIVLQGLMIAGQWTRQSEAQARSGETNLPDPGARQLQMIDELKGLNAKVDKLTAMLAGGEVTVNVKVVREPK
jgi:hypothetical protein